MLKKTWIGAAPKNCDICSNPIADKFVDGRTRPNGSWGILCEKCHKIHGFGLGTGNGQLYAKQGEDWVKVEG